MENIGLFISALIVVYLIPGQDVIAVLHESNRNGFRGAVMTGIGLAAARSIHVALAATGLTTLIMSAGWAFELFRWVGVGYLMWSAITLWCSSTTLSLTPSTESPLTGSYSAFSRGFLSSVTNPKALLFCSLLLPQFIDSQAANPAYEFVWPGVILVATGLGFDVFYAGFGMTLMNRMAHINNIEKWQSRTFAILLGLIALGLALFHLPNSTIPG